MRYFGLYIFGFCRHNRAYSLNPSHSIYTPLFQGLPSAIKKFNRRGNLIWTLKDDSDLFSTTPPPPPKLDRTSVLIAFYTWSIFILHVIDPITSCKFDLIVFCVHLIFFVSAVCSAINQVIFYTKTICIFVYIWPFDYVVLFVSFAGDRKYYWSVFFLLMLLVNLYFILCLWFSFASASDSGYICCCYEDMAFDLLFGLCSTSWAKLTRLGWARSETQIRIVTLAWKEKKNSETHW